jgi:hypothetical protein
LRAREKPLRAQYDSAQVENIDRNALLKKLRAIVTAQWAAKTAVLKQTRHRVVKASTTSKLQEDLTNTAKLLGEVKDEESYLAYIMQKEHSIPIFPLGRYTYENETFASFYSFLGAKGQHHFPSAFAIKQCYDQTGIAKRLQGVGRDDTSKKRKAQEILSSANPFDSLKES